MSKKKLFLIIVIVLNLINFTALCFLVYKNSNIKLKPPTYPSFPSSTSNETIEQFSPTSATFEKVFAQDHTWVSTLSAQNVRTLIATGDVIPARTVNNQVVSLNNFKWPYVRTFEFLKSSDLTLINLENPLIPDCPITTEGMIFCGDMRNIEGLTYAGVDLANLANNHMANHGMEGYAATQKLLTENGILPHGLDQIAYKDVRGMKVAFLGFTEVPGSDPFPNHVDEEMLVNKIHEARQNAQIIVVSFHWGDEYVSQPNARQKELGHKAIDAGADLIVGNHPHWIQPMEIYKDKFIMYAHGNFVFDQMWSRKTELGVVGRYTFYDKTLIDVEFFPVEIADFGQPYFLEEEQKYEVLDDLKVESEKLKSDYNNY